MVPEVEKKMVSLAEAGLARNHFWCDCSKSSKQPSCDGSQQGVGLAPKKIK